MAAYDTIRERNVSSLKYKHENAKRRQNSWRLTIQYRKETWAETRRDERVWLIGEGFTENLIEIAMKRRGGQIVIYMHSPDTPSKCELIITRQDSTEESRFQLVISRSWSRWLAGSNVEFFSCFWECAHGWDSSIEEVWYFLFSFLFYSIFDWKVNKFNIS